MWCMSLDRVLSLELDKAAIMGSATISRMSWKDCANPFHWGTINPNVWIVGITPPNPLTPKSFGMCFKQTYINVMHVSW